MNLCDATGKTCGDEFTIDTHNTYEVTMFVLLSILFLHSTLYCRGHTYTMRADIEAGECCMQYMNFHVYGACMAGSTHDQYYSH